MTLYEDSFPKRKKDEAHEDSSEVLLVKAVVLAAGEGLRLRPITSTRPKHMTPVGGAPLLEHCLLAIKKAGITDVGILVGYMKEKIQNYFEDGSRLGLRIEYTTQEKISGTASAVSMMEQYVNGEDFITAYGDLLIDSKVLRGVLDRFSATGSMTMGVVPVTHPEEYGVITMQDGYVSSISEKPKGVVQSNLVNSGIYIFQPGIFQQIRKTGKSARGEYEITDTLQSLLINGTKIAAAQLDPQDWLDIGHPWHLLEANRRVLTRIVSKVEGDVEPGAHLIGPVEVRSESRVRSGAYIEGPVLIGKGADIGPNCYIRPSTSIGERVRIGNACEIKNSIVMDQTHIGHLSYVGDSVIGAGCNLGAGTITANLRLDDGPVKVLVRDRVLDSGQRKLGTFMGDGVKTSIGTSIMPGVKIGASAWVGSIVVYKDIDEGSRFGFPEKST
jgi:bifunctional UDP-N-acetylglucosamine pyrophosphorylase/glucosamine-1-phosphate N-acetyltransferase